MFGRSLGGIHLPFVARTEGATGAGRLLSVSLLGGPGWEQWGAFMRGLGVDETTLRRSRYDPLCFRALILESWDRYLSANRAKWASDPDLARLFAERRDAMSVTGGCVTFKVLTGEPLSPAELLEMAVLPKLFRGEDAIEAWREVLPEYSGVVAEWRRTRG